MTRSATFVQSEMCVRLAHIISEISCLPGRLLKSKDVEQVKQWYIISLRELMEFEPVARAPAELRGMSVSPLTGLKQPP